MTVSVATSFAHCAAALWRLLRALFLLQHHMLVCRGFVVSLVAFLVVSLGGFLVGSRVERNGGAEEKRAAE